MYIIHLVRIWLLGIWDQKNWVPWPFSSFCWNHLISRKSLILSLHGYFFTSFLCAIFSTYLCASWTHCSGISFIIHYFFCQLCLIKMPLERLVWGWALPVLGRSLPVLGRSLISDQGVIGTISLRMSTPRRRWCSWSRGGNLALLRTHLRQCVTIHQYKYKYKYKHTCVWDSVSSPYISLFLSNSRWCNNTWVLSCAAAAIADDYQKDILACNGFWGSLLRKKGRK